MIRYNSEEKKVEEAIQQVYRDFALKYGEIQKSELSEEEKLEQIDYFLEVAITKEDVLRNTRSLSELSTQDKEILDIKEDDEPKKIDENVIDTLVSIYAKRAKIPSDIMYGTGILDGITLEEEKLEEIDTRAFEEELRQYFTEHYYDLLSNGYNHFLSKITEVSDGLIHDENGELIELAIKHNLNPRKFNCFGYQLTVQDGLVAEESMGKTNIFYASPEAVNQRIYDLYSKTLFQEQKSGEKSTFLNNGRALKNKYITYAEKNGIQIENPDVLETIEVDMAKVQGLAKYINRVINNEEGIEKGDYTKEFSEDIIRNYSKIMNLQWYDFGELESVKGLIDKGTFIEELHLQIQKDNIVRQDDFRPDIAYGTPEFIRKEYQKIMQQVKLLHQTNAFQEKYFDVEKITQKKQAYRRYIQENNIEGIDISIPEVEIDHERTEMIADALMSQYGKEYEDTENMKKRILVKLEENWAEIVTEAQVISVNEMFGKELKEMGCLYPHEQLYVRDNFVYLGDFMGATCNVIYATQEALTENLEFLDRRISDRDLNFEDKHIRESLVKYAEEQGFDMNIPSVESIENKGKQEREMFSFKGAFSGIDTEFMPDDPTARAKIDLEDTMIETIFKISEGVPGAIVGITKIMEADEFGFILLLGLDDMNIRGSQIWEAYKYLYNEDASKFAEAIKNRDEKMVNFINEQLASVGGEKAVTGGASFDRSKDPNKYRFTEAEVEQLRTQREKRIEKQKEVRDKMIANSPAKKKSLGQKRRELREAKKKEYRERLIAMGKKSIKELDGELSELQTKEQQAKELCEQYEEQLPEKNGQEL